MSVATVREMGDRLVVELPREMQEKLHLVAGSKIEMEALPEKLGVRRAKYTLEELVAQCDFSLPVSDEDREWEAMKPVGREII